MPTPLMAALDDLFQQAVVISALHSYDFREDYSIDQLMDAAYEDEYALLLESERASRADVDEFRRLHRAVPRPGFFARVLGLQSENPHAIPLANESRRLRTLQEQVATSKAAFMNHLGAQNAVAQEHKRLRHAKTQRQNAKTLLSSVTQTRELLDRSLRRHPGLEQRLMHSFSAWQSLPFADPVSALEQLAGLRISMQAQCASMALAEELVDYTENLLQDLLSDREESEYPAPFDAFSRASCAALMAASPNAPNFDDLLEAAIAPDAFALPESWLMLWNGIGATTTYATMVEGTSAAENARASAWCERWRAQLAEWPLKPLAALGIGSDSLQSAVCSLLDSHGEHRTGADVLMVLLVDLPGRSYASAAAIQFKRPRNDEPAISVDQGEWDQYRKLLRLEQASDGRIRAMHALARNMIDACASIPAVPLQRSLVHSPLDSSTNTYERARAPGRSSTVNWREYGEALPALLANALTAPASRFASAEQLFAWFEQHPAVDLPSFIMLQSVGGRPRSLTNALKHAKTLATTRGKELTIIPASGALNHRPRRDRNGFSNER